MAKFDAKPVLAISAVALVVWLYLTGRATTLLDSLFGGDNGSVDNSAPDVTATGGTNYSTPSAGGFAPATAGAGSDYNLTVPAAATYYMPFNYNQSPSTVPITVGAVAPVGSGCSGCGGCGGSSGGGMGCANSNANDVILSSALPSSVAAQNAATSMAANIRSALGLS